MKIKSIKVKATTKPKTDANTMLADVHFANVQYGFEYGAAKITRFFSDKKKGWVTMGLETPKYKNAIQIYVTKTGKVRIHSEGGEWKLAK